MRPAVRPRAMSPRNRSSAVDRQGGITAHEAAIPPRSPLSQEHECRDEPSRAARPGPLSGTRALGVFMPGRRNVLQFVGTHDPQQSRDAVPEAVVVRAVVTTPSSVESHRRTAVELHPVDRFPRQKWPEKAATNFATRAVAAHGDARGKLDPVAVAVTDDLRGEQGLEFGGVAALSRREECAQQADAARRRMPFAGARRRGVCAHDSRADGRPPAVLCTICAICSYG